MAESMRNLHLVLVIGAMCVVQTMAGICPYSSPLCNCVSGILTCTGLQQIPALNTGPDVIPVTELKFYGGNITSVSKNSLPPGLQKIRFSDTALTNISEDAFEALADTLHEIIFYRENFPSLPTALKKLTRLNMLAVQMTRVAVWDIPTIIQIGATVRTLYLVQTGLTRWPSWLSNFSVLQKLVIISERKIRSIPVNAFTSFKDSLRDIWLYFTDLKRIPTELSTLSTLELLDLSHNNFKDFTAFIQMARSPISRTLKTILLDLTRLPRMPNLSNFTSLLYISATNNTISDIPAGSLPVSVTRLNLTRNRLSSVPADIAAMAGLTDLDLSENSISSIGPNSFPSNLVHLRLSFNNLTVITNTSFRNLNLLQSLHLGHNPISAISPAAFSGLSSLRTLDLESAHLTEIPLAFTHLSPQSRVFFTTVQPLTCSCPAPPAIVTLLQSLENSTWKQLSCISGRSIDAYLKGQCGQPSAGR